LRILFLLLLIAGAIYLERVIVPSVPPLFVPTATPTRNPAAILLEAESLVQAGKLEQAEEAYREAIAVNPEDINSYIELARLQALMGHLDEAETSARNALLIEPTSALGAATLAWITDLQANQANDNQERLELLDQAREQIDRALAQNTDQALVHAYHAEILIDEYLFAGEDTYQAAREAAETAVTLDPQSLDAHRALAVIWESTGNYENALESYEAALRLNGNLSLLHLKIGDMYLNLGDIDTAVDRYVRASSLAPTDTLPLRRIVLAYAREGQYARASQYAADAVRLDPNNPYLHGTLGQMYRRNNELATAVTELGWAIHGGMIQGSWTVNGRQILVNDRTSIASGLGIGDTVQVEIEIQADGRDLALRIEPVAEEGATPVPGESRVGIVEDRVDAVLIEGLPLDPGDPAAVEIYYTYSLALAESGDCEQAADIAQAILLGIQEDETARFNAEEALRICGQLELTPTPEATATVTG
jgi:tetratricopeptide (TPR) repeat protein